MGQCQGCFGGKKLFPLEAWDALYQEDAIDAEIDVFDPHHHLWDPRSQPKGWPVPMVMLKALYCLLSPPQIHRMMTDDIRKKGQPFLTTFSERFPFLIPYMGQEMLNDMRIGKGGHNVVGTVYLECGWHEPSMIPALEPVGEAEMAAKVHRQHPVLCQGIVPFANLALGADVKPALEKYKQNPLVKGIRHGIAWTADPTIMGAPVSFKDIAYDPKFREGFALLSQYGFSYDCWLYHEQIDGLADLAKTFPETTIICDHVGTPLGVGSYKKEETLAQWEASIRNLAKYPNVYVKLSGLAMHVCGFGFTERPRPPTSEELATAFKSRIRFVIDQFGIDRCMFASNFPVDKVSSGYTALFNAYKLIVRDLPLSDRKKLFELNARKVYRIPA